MEMPEFIDTYSDDILYIIESRKVLLTHPFRVEIKSICDASFCRLLAVFMVGSIEAMLQHWGEKDKFGILKKYFEKHADNDDRIQSLYNAFKKVGTNVDKKIFDAYLAIKYLRNIIVHSRWKPYEKEWIEKRDFPTDTRKLAGEHWHRMLEVNQNMMMYIASTGMPELKRRTSNDKVIRLKMKREEELKPTIITRRDLPYVVFRNLENIALELYSSIKKAAISEKRRAKNLSPEEEKISHKDAKRLFYLAAKKAGEEGFEEILKGKQLMKEALFFWDLYKQETFTKSNIQQKEIKESFKVLMELHKRKSYPEGVFLWDEKLPKEVKVGVVKKRLKNYRGLSEIEIIKSLDIGKLTYEFIRNITPLSLFAIYFPVIDRENAKTLVNEEKFILTAWKLREAWYFFIELREHPETSDWLFYERLFDELLA